MERKLQPVSLEGIAMRLSYGFEDRSLLQIGAELGLSEDAARMRGTIPGAVTDAGLSGENIRSLASRPIATAIGLLRFRQYLRNIQWQDDHCDQRESCATRYFTLMKGSKS